MPLAEIDPKVFDRVISIVGTAITVVAFLYALWSARRRKTAEQAAANATEKLLTYNAAVEFAAVTRFGYELILVLRGQDWNSAARLIALVSSGLGRAKGLAFGRLEIAEIERLRSLEAEVVRWTRLIPNAGSTPESAQLSELSEQCLDAIHLTEEISARLNQQVLQFSEVQ